MALVSLSPPRAPPIKYTAPLGTRWAKEKAAAGGDGAFDLPSDPKNIGSWILGECIGKGASGRVKIAKHRHTGQLAAIKILPIAPLVSSRASLATQQAKSDKQRLGIDREITMMKLMNHPNIMRIYDVYEGDKELFLVLEYVEGGELFDFLVNRGRLPPAEALAYFKQIVYGLNYAHTFSIIHRDLKPENILIASLSPPLIKIADWGMAAFAHPSHQLETSCGSPHYASPEIVNGQSYNGNATDVWSCGVILYALLTGRLPFDDKNVRVLLSKVKSGKYDMPTWIDPLAKDLLDKMLVVDVEKRITIPGILAHPWLSLGATSNLDNNSTSLGTLELPPSPSILARPIESPSLIDPELFASLRVIWGRHTDPQGDLIKKDLCSPAGQGIHAKAFYFLLSQYREKSLRNNIEDSEAHEFESDMEDIKLDYVRETRLSTVNKRYDGNRNSMLSVPSFTTSRACSPVNACNVVLDPTGLRQANTSTGVKARDSSLVAPRPQKITARTEMDFWQTRSRVLDDRRFKSVVNLPKTLGPSGAVRGGPRPPPSRRGYTYAQPDSGVSTVQFPTHLQTQAVVNIRRPKTATGACGSRRSSLFVPSPNPLSDQLELPMAVFPVLAPQPVPVIYAPVPRAPPPPIEADIVPPVDVEPGAIKEQLDTHIKFFSIVPNAGASSCQQGAVASRDQAATSHAQADKENQSVGDESWSYVEPIIEPRGRGLGLDIGKDAGKTMDDTTNTRTAPSGAKGKKERKSRPPMLDFRNLNLNQQKRSTILGSPISITSPIIPPLSTGRLLTSPVVGEFKGWFSNLFNWKHNVSSQGGVLYSTDDVFKTRADIGRLLEGFGVVVEGRGFDKGMTLDDSTRALKCKVEDPASVRTAFTLKAVRFRIEFTVVPSSQENPLPSQNKANHPELLSAPAPTQGGSSSPASSPFPMMTPRTRHSLLIGHTSKHHATPGGNSPSLQHNCDFPPGAVCAVFMAYEKGSVSSFRVMWRKLREVYTAGCASLSPAMASTPMTEQPERFAT